jgi:hypothetical protein
MGCLFISSRDLIWLDLPMLSFSLVLTSLPDFLKSGTFTFAPLFG